MRRGRKPNINWRFPYGALRPDPNSSDEDRGSAAQRNVPAHTDWSTQRVKGCITVSREARFKEKTADDEVHAGDGAMLDEQQPAHTLLAPLHDGVLCPCLVCHAGAPEEAKTPDIAEKARSKPRKT